MLITFLPSFICDRPVTNIIQDKPLLLFEILFYIYKIHEAGQI